MAPSSDSHTAPERGGKTDVPKSPTPSGAAPAGPSDAPLPSDRDQSHDATGGVPSDQIRQAHQDVQHGLKDTSRGEATDEAYRKQK